MDLTEFLKAKAGLRDRHDLISHLRGGSAAFDAEIKRLQKTLDARTKAEGALDALARLETGGGFGSYGYERIFFVAAYAHGAGDRPALTRLDCVVVPEAVRDQYRHRPQPQTPEQRAKGVTTMASVMVPGTEIARECAARYASGVRLGTFDDVLVERCGICGSGAAVFCSHYFDTSNEYQHASVGRLCVRCPRVEDIANASCDLFENLPFLPLVRPHQK